MIAKTETVDVKTPLSKVLPLLGRYPAVIVRKNKEYYGVVDSRSIFRAGAPLKLQKNQSIERYVSKVPSLERGMQIDDVILSFYKAGVEALPFAENGTTIGVLDRGTLLKILLSLRLLDGIRISEVMSTPMIAVGDRIAMAQAKAVMENSRVSRLAVLHEGKFTGMLTYYALLKNYAHSEALPEMKSSRHSPADVEISKAVEPNPRSASQDRDLAYAARSMVENGVSSLVITDGRDTPIGMLTIRDILEAVLARRRIGESRVFISGLDGETKEYEAELRGELKQLMSKIEGKEIKMDYITMHIKKVRANRYDIKVRAAIRGRSTISAHVTDFLLERTFKKALAVLRRDILEEKGRVLAARKSDRFRVIE